MIQELGGDLIPALAISLGFLFGATWLVAATIDSLYKTKCNARLKDKLIERGSTAHEIDVIIKAGSATGYEVNQPVPPIKTAQY